MITAKPTPHHKIIWTVNPNLIEGDDIDKNARSPVRIMWILLLIVLLAIIVANFAYRWKQANQNFHLPSVAYQCTIGKFKNAFAQKSELNEPLCEVSNDVDSESFVNFNELGTEL